MKVFTDQVSHTELEVVKEKLEELGYRVKYLPKGPLFTVTEIEINVYF